MNVGFTSGVGMAVLAAGWALSACAQSPGGSQPLPQTLLSSFKSVPSEQFPAGDLMREIDDPSNGDRWLLVRDPSRPGGPGRLFLAPSASSFGSRQGGSNPARLVPVIHGGDRLIVEEKTALVEAHLDAVALGPAFTGGALSVRLVIGGIVLRAVALGPGRAALVSATEGQL